MVLFFFFFLFVSLSQPHHQYATLAVVPVPVEKMAWWVLWEHSVRVWRLATNWLPAFLACGVHTSFVSTGHFFKRQGVAFMKPALFFSFFKICCHNCNLLSTRRAPWPIHRHSNSALILNMLDANTCIFDAFILRNEMSLNASKVCVVFSYDAFLCWELYTPIMN